MINTSNDEKRVIKESDAVAESPLIMVRGAWVDELISNMSDDDVPAADEDAR